MTLFDDATAAVEGALEAGASYADARAMLVTTEGLSAQDGILERLSRTQRAGVGVRALVGSSWGFFAVPEPSGDQARRAGHQATAIARASAMVPGPPVELADVGVVTAHWDSTWTEHPHDVPVTEKADLLVAVTATMSEVEGVSVAEASITSWDTEKAFVSSQGHRISQHTVECGTSMSATAVGDEETQRRSYGGIGGQWGTRGYELVREADLAGNAGRVADEAVALLTAPLCEPGTVDLILGSEQLALQIHESVGHAIELDRILGWEAAFAGTSFLDLAQLGTFRYGSELMNITADATLPGALGSFGYDDEGTPAQNVDIVRDGVWVGVLSGRDSAARAGLPPGGMVRCDGYDRLPMVRMTNVGLVPGESSLEEMIAATDDGIFMDTNRSWSIDDKRLNFQFGCEIGREVKGGQLGRLVRNPTYTGITPQFWGSLDMLGNAGEWIFWGTPNCGKGQPMQIGHTGHPAVPARFRGVRVGVRGRVMDTELTSLMRVGGDLLDLRTVGMDVLSRIGGRAEAEVIVQQGRSAVTRFANSFIHQNVADDWQRVRLKVVNEGRLATGSTNRLDAGSLDRLVEDTLLAATYRPVDPDWPGVGPPEAWLTVDDDHYDKDTHFADPASRAEVVKEFVNAGQAGQGGEAGPDLEAAGFCSTDGWKTFFANTDDHRAEGQASLATIEAIHRTAADETGWRADGSGWQSSSRLGDLDGAAAGRIAADKARAGAFAVDIEPGVYEVVLEPAAVADIVGFLADGFSAKAYREGTSFVKAKKQQFDTDISLWDDALDSQAIGMSFDAEGTPKSAVDLVLEGVSNALVHDRRTAAKAKVRSTGHGIEGGETWGPYPSNLFLGDGDTSPADLIASVRRGLLVTEFWYTRTLDPKTQVVTGLTRNGTFLIEDGVIVGAVKNLRFTQSYVEALGPGNVLGIGDDPRLYGSSCVVPSLHLAAWNFTGGSKA